MRIILISESGYNGSGYGICFPLPGYDKFVMITETAVGNKSSGRTDTGSDRRENRCITT